MQAINSELNHSQDTTVTARTTVQWDGDDGGSTTIAPNGLGNVDLTQAGGANSLSVTVDFNDLPVDLTFNIYSGADSSTATLHLPGGLTSGPPVHYSIPFSAFSTLAGSGANFASVGAIELVINGFTPGDRPDHPRYPRSRQRLGRPSRDRGLRHYLLEQRRNGPQPRSGRPLPGPWDRRGGQRPANN